MNRKGYLIMSSLSVFDKLQNYSSIKAKKKKNLVTELFDITTPQGMFLAKVHNAGYSMYKELEWVRQDNENIVIPQTEYDSFSETIQENYRPRIKEYSELYYALTTKGNQEINAIAGSGKALVNGTKVLTDKGYSCIETLAVGNKVYGVEGILYDVVGVYPQGKHTVYRVWFSDDKSIDCNGSHLWTLDNGETLTTDKMVDRNNLFLPTVLPLDLEQFEEIRLNAYVLGILYGLGEENNNQVFVNTEDYEIITKINFIYRITNDLGIPCILFDDDRLNYVSAMHLLGDKSSFVLPTEYKYTTVTNRLELLVGLIDSMGKIKDNHYELSIDNELFAKDIIFIAESLGLIVKTETNKNLNIISIYKTSNFDSLHTTKRLREVCDTKRKIVKVECIEEEQEMTCIEILSPSHLYLTEHCIPTHNTTALIFKVMHDIVSGEAMLLDKNETPILDNIWVCTFLKSGADELSEKLAYWQRKFGYVQTYNRVVFSTLDAEFKRCLNAMNVATNIDTDSARKLLKETIDDLGIRRNGEPLRQEDYEIISTIVTYCRGRLTEKYNHPSALDYDLTKDILDLLIQQFADKRKVAGIMDFEDMSELLYHYLYVEPNKNVQDFVAHRYNYIYIDEFQDTSQLAYAILKFYARDYLKVNKSIENKSAIDTNEFETEGLITDYVTDRGKIVVIGDTSQCVGKDTKVNIEGKLIPIKEVKEGMLVKSVIGKGFTDFIKIDEVKRTQYKGTMLKIRTEQGYTLSVTPTHKMYIKDTIRTEPLCLVQFDGELIDGVYESSLYNNCVDYGEKKYRDTNIDTLEDLAYKHQSSLYRKAELLPKEPFLVVIASQIKVNDIVCIYDENTLKEDKVVDIEKYDYDDYVYDLNISKTRNFIANGIVSHNCIYSFRGSDSTLLAVNFANDYEPTKCALSYNWRCPKNILDPIVPCIHQNRYSKNQVIQASKDGGELYAYDFSTYKLMVDQLKKDIEKDLNDGLDVAVLVRTNYDGALPAFVLATEPRYDFSLSGYSMTLQTALPQRLLKMSSLLLEKTTPTVLSCLYMLCSYTERYAIRNMIATLKASNKGIWDVPLADIHYSCRSLEPFIVFIQSIYFTDGKKDVNKQVQALRGIYVWLYTNVFGGTSAYAESARTYIETIIFILDTENFNDIYEFIEYMERIDDKLKGKVGKEKAPITIATVHESKGKEYDSVYVWNVIDGQFPSNKANKSNINDLEEERRIFYIACTRAKQREHIYTLQGKHSMFLDEMGITLTNPIQPSVKLKN